MIRYEQDSATLIVYIEILKQMESTSYKNWTSFSPLHFHKGVVLTSSGQNEIKICIWIWSLIKCQCCQGYNALICFVSGSGHLLHWPLCAPGGSECGLPGVSIYPPTLPLPGAGIRQAPESPLDQALAHASSLMDHPPSVTLTSDERFLQRGSSVFVCWPNQMFWPLSDCKIKKRTIL